MTGYPTVVVGTTSESDKTPKSILSSFKHEISIEVSAIMPTFVGSYSSFLGTIGESAIRDALCPSGATHTCSRLLPIILGNADRRTCRLRSGTPGASSPFCQHLSSIESHVSCFLPSLLHPSQCAFVSVGFPNGIWPTQVSR